MSLQPQPIPPVPDETAGIARAASPKGNRYMRMRDTPGSIYGDGMLVPLFPCRGQPAYPPWRLALVTVKPLVEGSRTAKRLMPCAVGLIALASFDYDGR